MKKAVILLVGIALAIVAGLSVYAALSRFAPETETEQEDWSDIEQRSSSSSSVDIQEDGDGMMIRWEDIESSFATEADVTAGSSSSAE